LEELDGGEAELRLLGFSVERLAKLWAPMFFLVDKIRVPEVTLVCHSGEFGADSSKLVW
jgi:hypothetical protein